MFTLSIGVFSHIIGALVALSVTLVTPARVILGATENVNMTPAQMLSSLRSSLDKAKEYNVKVQAMLKKATKKKNVMLSSCLEPKAKDLAFWTKEMGFTVDEFEGARKSEGKERLIFIYQKGMTISDKVDKLFIEATQCVGDEHFIAPSSKGVNLQVVGPDYVLDPNEQVPVGNSFDSMDSPTLDTDLNGPELSMANPDVSDWAGDVIWPEATQFE